MRSCYRSIAIVIFAVLGLGACQTTNTYKTQIHPPDFDHSGGTMIAENTLTQHDYIVAGFTPPDHTVHVREKKNCAFSSFHRKETVGYEFDANQRLSFRIDPDIDIFDLDDIEAEFSVRYTVFLGGKPTKRPCTYGTGYYGLVPYVGNNPDILEDMTDIDHIKSLVEDELF